MTDDEIAAVHEAAHAVVAMFGEWTKLAGPIILKGRGCGDITMSTDGEAIQRALQADPNFDRDLPRIQLVGALLAGQVAERMLVEKGRARLSDSELSEASEGDCDNISEQLARLDPPRPGLLDQLDRDVRARLGQPAIWSAVEQFAAILLDRRRLEAEEASAILGEIGAKLRLGPSSAQGRSHRGRQALLLAFMLWEGWWTYQFFAAPRPDYEMRTVTALMLGLILPGLLIAFVGAILLGYRAARRSP